MSGIDSQRTTRSSLLLDPAMATKMFSESARDLAATGSVVFPMGVVGSPENASWPE